MSKEAKYCDECLHFRFTEENTRDVCSFGHKPRMYIPQTYHAAMIGTWGWKRRCEDFKKAKYDMDTGRMIEVSLEEL